MYVKRGRRFSAIEVRLKIEQQEKTFSANLLKTKEIILLPTYTGKRTSRIRISNVPPTITIDQ